MGHFLRAALYVLSTSLVLLASTTTTASASTSFTPERIIVVGDIHGDLEQAKAILRLANVVDTEGKWAGGSHTKLVQMGDLVDRGEQDKEVLDFFFKLHGEAKEAGGSVTLLIGNHEIMNMMGDVRYVHPKSMQGFGGRDAHKKAWSKTGYYGTFIRENFQLAHQYNGTLFVHAGLSAAYASYGVEKLNAAAKKALQRDDFGNPLFGGDGPVWTRLLINKAEYGRCDMVESSLAKLSNGKTSVAEGAVERMVVGHTPQRELRVKAYCDAKLIAVDVGISKFMYGGLAAVEISQDPSTGETILEEIVPNDVDERAEAELNKLEQQGGADMELLQEMLQTVNEAEGTTAKKNRGSTWKKEQRDNGDGDSNKNKNSNSKMSSDEIAQLAAKIAREKKEKARREVEENKKKASETDAEL